MSLTRDIAQAILDGFDKHYRLFREISAGAKDRYERADWVAAREASVAREELRATLLTDLGLASTH